MTMQSALIVSLAFNAVLAVRIVQYRGMVYRVIMILESYYQGERNALFRDTR